jgi:hypothetical protein
MAVKLLIRTNDTYAIPGNVTEDWSGVFKTGYIVEARPDSWTPGGKEVIPKFVALRITDAEETDVVNYLSQWKINLDYEVVNNDTTIDGWRLRVYAITPGVSGRGGITRDKVENFLNEWNASVFTFGTNSVTFDVAIYSDGTNPGAIQSNGFWGFNTTLINFAETSYNEVSGEHIVEADYSALTQVDPAKVERIVIGRLGSILTHNTAGKIITFSIMRADVRSIFQNTVKRAVEKVVYGRRYYIDPTWTRDIRDNYSGYREITLAELLAQIGDKVNDDATTLDTHSLLI